jgi:hypothetical protein
MYCDLTIILVMDIQNMHGCIVVLEVKMDASYSYAYQTATELDG